MRIEDGYLITSMVERNEEGRSRLIHQKYKIDLNTGLFIEVENGK